MTGRSTFHVTFDLRPLLPNPSCIFFPLFALQLVPFPETQISRPEASPGDSAALQHRHICLLSRLALRPQELACQKSLNLDFKANSLRGCTGGEKKKRKKPS